MRDSAKAVVKGATKGLVSEVPYIGGLVIGAWDGYHEARHQDFINALSEQLKKLDEKKVDKDYIQSEEFCDLFVRALRSITFHRSKVRARFILGLVVDSVRNDRDHDLSTSLKESFLIILDQLTDEEMKLLYDFSEGKYNRMTKEKFYEKAKGVEIDGLIAKGILMVDATWDQAIIETTLGKKFVSYMRIIAKESV